MNTQPIANNIYKPIITYNSLSIGKLLTGIFLFSAVLGYVLSYQKVYLFHVVAVLYFLSMVLGFIKVRKSSFKTMQYIFLFLGYAIISMLWAPSLVNGLYYIFYFICATTIIFVVVNYAQDINKLNFIFKVLAVFFLLNFFVGLLETTGLFRLPASPYYGSFNTRPSGFNFNLNNFGFVFLAIFPFLFLYPSKVAKATATLLATWFAFKLESKGFFLGLLAFYFIFFLVEIKKKRTWHLITGLGITTLIATFFIIFILENVNLNNRIFSTFGQIERGVELMVNSSADSSDSTGQRSTAYTFGLQELFNSYGVGRGVAGVTTNLINKNVYKESNGVCSLERGQCSFHNFFLEMLIDFGIIPFLLIMYGYLKLVRKLLSISKNKNNIMFSYYAKASALSLLTIIPASISPSSIIYVFTFWLVVGFSLSITKISKRVSCA